MDQRSEIERAISLFIEAINSNDASRIPLTDDVVMSGPMMPEPTIGQAEVRQYIDETSPFIAHMELKTTLIDDDRAAIIMEFTGLNGVVIEGARFLRFRDGKISSDQNFFDSRPLFKGAN